MSFLFAPTTQTSTQQSQQQQQSSASGTSNTGVTLSPELQQLSQSLMSFGSKSMNDPMAQLAPIRNAGLQGINQSFADVPNQVARQMASRGYGSSGALGDSLYRANLSRAGAVSNFEGGLAQAGINQMNQGASLSEQLLNSLKGSSTSSQGSSSSSGTSDTTQVKPGPSIFSSLVGLATTLLGLPGGSLGGQLFGGGGGGGDTGGPGYNPNDWGPQAASSSGFGGTFN